MRKSGYPTWRLLCLVPQWQVLLEMRCVGLLSPVIYIFAKFSYVIFVPIHIYTSVEANHVEYFVQQSTRCSTTDICLSTRPCITFRI